MPQRYGHDPSSSSIGMESVTTSDAGSRKLTLHQGEQLIAEWFEISLARAGDCLQVRCAVTGESIDEAVDAAFVKPQSRTTWTAGK